MKIDKPRIEDTLADALAKAYGERPVREYMFSAQREWKFDLCYPSQKLAVEVNGRYHLHHSQHRKDCEKVNAALLAGWTVLQYPASVVNTKSRLPLIVEQIGRSLCGVCDPELDEEVLTGELRRAA